METEKYKTKDLAEASALLTRSQKLIDIEREDKICWFVFENKRSCEKIATDFWFGICMVNAKNYYQAMVTLKNRIFST